MRGRIYLAFKPAYQAARNLEKKKCKQKDALVRRLFVPEKHWLGIQISSAISLPQQRPLCNKNLLAERVKKRVLFAF